ncbi:MAG: Ig-like domain-containing protein, partial [Actinomycetota bacterium]
MSASSLDADWSTTLSGTTTENNLKISDSAVDKDGNIYVIGMSHGSFDIDPGENTVPFTFDRRASIIKYNSTGGYVWHMTVGAANSSWNSISFEPNGEAFWVTGSICGGNGSQTHNFSRTGTAVSFFYQVGVCHNMVVKYDTNGVVLTNPSTSTPIAMRLAHSTLDSYGYGIAASANGVYVTGTYKSASTSTVDFNPLGTAYPMVGARNTLSGGRDAFIAKYTSVGDLAWVKSYGSSLATGSEFGWDIGIDSSENVYTIGFFTSALSYDLGGGAINFSTQRHYLVKLDSSGAYQWAFKFGGAETGNYERTTEIHVSSDGTVHITGYLAGTFDFRGMSSTAKNITAPTSLHGGYLVSYASNGEYRWHVALALKAHPSGTTQNYSLFEAVTVMSDGTVFAAGHYRGTMDFDGSASEYLLAPSTSSCGRDRFVARYSTSGQLLWAERPETTCAVGTPNDVNLGGFAPMAVVPVGTGVLAVFRSYSPVPRSMIMYGADTSAPTAPGTPDLTAGTDTGASSTDDLTNDTTPSFGVVASEAGGTVTVTAQRIGQTDVSCTMTGATGSGGECTFTTPLSEGAWSVTAVHQDGAGNVSASSGQSTITVDTTSPSLQTIVPARDATAVATDANLQFTWDENVAKGTGNILVRTGSSCTTTAQTISVANAAVTVSGAGITVDPPSTLAGSTVTCAEFAAGVVRDIAGNNAPLHNPTATGGMRFTTAAAAPTIVLAPSSATSLSRTIGFVLTATSGQIDCGTVSTVDGVDFVFGNISSISVSTASPTECAISATSSIAAGSSGTSTLTEATTFEVSYSGSAPQVNIASGSPASVVVTIAAVTTTTAAPTTTTAAPTTTSEVSIALQGTTTTVATTTSLALAAAPA